MRAVVGCTRILRYFGYVEMMESGNQVTLYLIVLVRFYKIIMFRNLVIVDTDVIKASLCKFLVFHSCELGSARDSGLKAKSVAS